MITQLYSTISSVINNNTWTIIIKCVISFNNYGVIIIKSNLFLILICTLSTIHNKKCKWINSSKPNKNNSKVIKLNKLINKKIKKKS